MIFGSSSSSSSDEESSSDGFEEDLAGFVDRVRAKNSVFFEETVPSYDETDFVSHFRVSSTVAHQISQRFERSHFYNSSAGKYGHISPQKQVHIFLWFAGHQTASFLDVADRFGITLSSLFRITRRLTMFLSSLSQEVIRWPNDDEKREAEEWFRSKGFPGAIGTIDGTHIRVDRPHNDPDSYYNRKKYHSIQLQVVCDGHKKITSVFVGFPGSVHDARVFRRSPLGQNLQERCGDFFLLGDSAYPCSRNLVTPFRSTGRETRQQRNFNRLLSSCRVVSEHCIGLLKQKFRQLYHIKLRNIATTVHFIRACCVLHNLALSDEFPVENLSPVENTLDVSHQEENDEDEARDLPEGVAYRQYLLSSMNLN
ncbi:hypothetical protein GE061_000171 [Apolygus lucorum]|uniref:Putative nuclease HARBI1 n=1 Tax=Apolygus lucorum TaxID=248454 RepID=A0A8S9Y669_APOLU|nr:hypothetical protein GE061_000171 [Apolygus lucorum]